MTLPNFLVIGAAKCGTDSLCNYLGQHPKVFMSQNKEPNFFIAEGQQAIPYQGPGDKKVLTDWGMWVSTLDRYEALFSHVTTEEAIGEGTTWYLYDGRAAHKIHAHIPRAKLIAVLRNPVDRAYSAYTMLLRDGREPLRDFARALEAEDERVCWNWEPMWHYRRMGFYASQLQCYFDIFDQAQIHVVLYDDFTARPGDVTRDLFRFLEVDDEFEPDTSTRYNVSLVPRHQTYHMLIAGENPVKTVVKSVLPGGVRQRVKARLITPNLTRPTPLAPEVRASLVEVFRSDILQLQELINRDLSHWLR
jgi:hypothetical protein